MPSKIEELNNKIINDYLCKINSEFQSIGIGKNNFSVEYDENLFKILKEFESQHIISSCSITKRKRIQ